MKRATHRDVGEAVEKQRGRNGACGVEGSTRQRGRRHREGSEDEAKLQRRKLCGERRRVPPRAAVAHVRSDEEEERGENEDKGAHSLNRKAVEPAERLVADCHAERRALCVRHCEGEPDAPD